MEESRKYGIKAIELSQYAPNLVHDTMKGQVDWKTSSVDIKERVTSFLVFVAKIKFTEAECYSAIYPHPTSSDCFVLANVDKGKHLFLLNTIRDKGAYPRGGERINKIREEMIFIDASYNDLLSIYQEILD